MNRRLQALGCLAALLATLAAAQTYTNMSVSGSFNGYTYSNNMTLVTENLWQGDFFLYLPTNRFIFTSGVSTWWGETNQTAFVPPLSGTAETNPTPVQSCMISLSNMPLTWHRFRFNPATCEYSVTPVSNTTKRLPPVMTVAGTFNNWQAGIPNLESVSYNLWQGDFLISAPTGQFKFTINNWQYGYGDTNQPSRNLQPVISGVAEQVPHGYDIQFTNATPGFYRITFKSDTFEYSIRLLYSTTSGMNLLQNPSFETQGSSSSKPQYWEWGFPDTHGSWWAGHSNTATRQGWRSHSGTYEATLNGSWSGSDFGGWWREGAGLPGRRYQLSGWFWADNTWSSAFQEIKLEFFTTNLTLLDYASLPIVANSSNWTRNSISALSPSNTAWVRAVIAMSGAGSGGALQFDDFQLIPVGGRTQDFETWPLITNDTTIGTDWILNYGTITSNSRPATATGGLFISEYVEGSSNNKAVEIFNASTATINFAAGAYYLQQFNNGSTNPSYSIALTGTIAAGSTYIVCHSSATQTIKELAQQIAGNLNFNGDDALVLRSGGTIGPIIDRFGQIGDNPGSSGWDNLTADHTLRRKLTTLFGDTNAYSPFHPTDEWVVYPRDVFDDLGHHEVSSTGSEYVPLGRGASLAPLPSNYLQSAQIDGGIGNLSFWCRLASDSSATTYAVDTSPDGMNWSNAAILTFDNMNWEYRSVYIYQPGHSYVRLLHIGGSNRLYIDEIEVAEPVGIMRVQDFSLWTSSAFTNEGDHELNEWAVLTGYISTNKAYADYAAWLSPSNGVIRSPLFTDGAGTITFHHRRASGDYPPNLLIQTSSDLTNWTTRGTIVPASTSYVQSSVYMYVPTPAYVRILCATNTSDTNLPQTAYAVIDNITIGLPVLYRNQNFDSWPTRTSYGDSQYQGWHLHAAIVDSEEGSDGQVARLRDTVSTNAYILSPEFPDGIGTVAFWFRKWSTNETSPTYEIQTSPNGSNWTVRSTLMITNGAAYQRFDLYLYEPTSRYVRIYHTAGAGRALFDEISISAPQPPANVALSGWHVPAAPYVNDNVYLWLTAVEQYGAYDVTVTAFYRIGTSGAFTVMNVFQTNTFFYVSQSSIPPQPTNTIVQYYFKVNFKGPGSDSTSPKYFPSGGSNSPAWYGIPRNKPQQVWVNELSYTPIGFLNGWVDTNEFIELCGPVGYDLSGWTIQLVYGEAFTNDLQLNSYAHYRILNGTVLADETNGYGFFVLGDNSWGPTVVDMIFTNFTKYNPYPAWDDNLADGHPDAVVLLNEMGGVEYKLSYEGYIFGYRYINQSQDSFDTNTVALIGSGSNFEDFVWVATNATPGGINAGQTLVPREEPPPVIPPDINIVHIVRTTNIVIYSSGNTNTPAWHVAPYATTNLHTAPQHWSPITPFNSVYEGGGTNRIWFSLPTNRMLEIYRVQATAP